MTKQSSSNSSLRITSGVFRGRSITSPATSATHPMGSREKMALFNTLISLIGPLDDVENVLDCYCGSGALGLEALSRGAKNAVFVDNNVAALQSVKNNIDSLGVYDRTEVIKTDVAKISLTSATWKKYNLILVDPPYDKFQEYTSNLAVLSDSLTPNGVLVLSHPDSINPASIFSNLELISTKSYAAANLSFFRRTA